MTEMTRFDLENQQIQVRIAEALEDAAASLEVMSETLMEQGIHEGYLSRTDLIADGRMGILDT